MSEKDWEMTKVACSLCAELGAGTGGVDEFYGDSVPQSFLFIFQ